MEKKGVLPALPILNKINMIATDIRISFLNSNTNNVFFNYK